MFTSAGTPKPLWLPVMLLACACAEAGPTDLLDDGSVFRDAIIPIYSEGSTTSCALIEIGTLHRDYQTRGFFRIGLLPCVRAEQVEILIQDPQGFRKTFSDVASRMSGRKSWKALEMHDVSIQIEGEPEPRLVATRVRLRDNGDWDLVDGCRLRLQNHWVDLPRSRMKATGNQPGLVRTSASGDTRAYDPFADSPSSQQITEINSDTAP